MQKTNRVRKVCHQVNQELRALGKELGISADVTTYVARHSFATVLKKSGVNIGIISQALGHQDIKTTQIYLDSFDNEQIDEAMKFLAYLHKKRQPPRTQMAEVCLFQVKHLHLL